MYMVTSAVTSAGCSRRAHAHVAADMHTSQTPCIVLYTLQPVILLTNNPGHDYDSRMRCSIIYIHKRRNDSYIVSLISSLQKLALEPKLLSSCYMLRYPQARGEIAISSWVLAFWVLTFRCFRFGSEEFSLNDGNHPVLFLFALSSFFSFSRCDVAKIRCLFL